MFYLHSAVSLILFIIGGVIGWKIYIYFISASEAVTQSTVGHYTAKFFNGFFLGIIFVLVYLWLTGVMGDFWSYLNAPSAKSEKSAVSQTLQQNSDKPIQLPVGNAASFSCTSSANQTEATVCSNSNLIKADVENHNLYQKALAKDNSYATQVHESMMNERNACGTDSQCIYFAYDKASSNYKQLLGM